MYFPGFLCCYPVLLPEQRGPSWAEAPLAAFWYLARCMLQATAPWTLLLHHWLLIPQHGSCQRQW
jgi:hypothetical protein